MSRSWWTRFVVLFFIVVVAAVHIYPTLSNLDPAKSRFPIKEKINLGLDLQGGLFMVMGVDFNRVFKEIVDRQVGNVQSRVKEKNISVTSVSVLREGVPVDDPQLRIEFNPSSRDALKKLLKDEYGHILRFIEEGTGSYHLGLSLEYRSQVKEKTISQSIEVIRNRIDEFGVAEPVITSRGNDRVVVELPGIKEIDRAKDLIGRTAKLEFRIVDDQGMSPDQLAQLVTQIEKEKDIAYKEGMKFSEYTRKINEFAKGKLPADREIAFERVKDQFGQIIPDGRVPYLLNVRAEVTGDDLEDANVQFDSQNQKPIVGFTFNPKGAVTFERLTGENIKNRLAIVLDGLVHSAPVIQSKIGARGQITLGTGNYDKVLKEATDLSIVLRAGALPAQLDLLEQRVVGPSLGQDSVRGGALAAILGSLAVFIMISIYYRFSGVIATFSLILNVLFVLACLVGLEATLTMPGIAGIALTVGIAVDSNVVIYERIREELRAGKNIYGAVEAGFQKALRTIMDSNVTNAMAAIVLLVYGTGAIKGFAVTLLIGILTTLFTAVFVCKLFFELYLKVQSSRNVNTISI